MLCFRKIPLAKKIMDKRGVSRFSVGNFLSYSAKNFHRGTLLCCVAENFRQRKTLWIKEGGIKKFRRKFFGLTMPKTFANESFCVVFHKTSGSEKDHG